MQGAVPALEVHTTRTGGRKRRDGALVSPQPGVIEIPREIRPFPLADVAVEAGPLRDHVLGASSEVPGVRAGAGE